MSHFDCGECGKHVGSDEFHSYESCVLYLLEYNPEQMSDRHWHYIREAGIRAMQERHDGRNLPANEHLSECYAAQYPKDEGVYCTCRDWSP